MLIKKLFASGIFVVMSLCLIWNLKERPKSPNTEIIKGTCSLRASNMGDHQKVIAYSAFGNIESPYWWGISTNILWTLKLFPGWLIRIYTDNPEPLIDLEEEYPTIFFVCDVRSLPPPVTDLTDYPAMMWRFFPLGDSQIDIINFRDTDSRLSKREAVAVEEWLKSNKTLHVTRDHLCHKNEIPGGGWGAKLTPKNRNIWLKMRDKLFKGSYMSNITMNLDQTLLKEIVWSKMKTDVMAHDSQYCRRFTEGTVPWPTKRHITKFFVHSRFYRGEWYMPKRCPVACRPKDHQDWKFC